MSRQSKSELSDTTGWRTTWPTAPLRGQFMVPRIVVLATEAALASFRGSEGSHEGIVFWGGCELSEFTLYTTLVIPRASHTWGSVACDEAAMRKTIHALRAAGLGLLAQVYSHPGGDARHSYGDDERIFLPFDGMLSIVVPHYAMHGVLPLTSCGIHQFQSGQWVLCTENLEAFRVMPEVVDLR